MKRYFLIDLFGNETQVSKLEFYVWKYSMNIVGILFGLVFIGVLIDIIRF